MDKRTSWKQQIHSLFLLKLREKIYFIIDSNRIETKRLTYMLDNNSSKQSNKEKKRSYKSGLSWVLYTLTHNIETGGKHMDLNLISEPEKKQTN